MLTVKQIQGAKPKEKPYKLSDGGGMFLFVDVKGNRRWQMDFRFGGKRKSLALGPYPAVGLKEARIARDEARKLLSEGVVHARLEKRKNRQPKAGESN